MTLDDFQKRTCIYHLYDSCGYFMAQPPPQYAAIKHITKSDNHHQPETNSKHQNRYDYQGEREQTKIPSIARPRDVSES